MEICGHFEESCHTHFQGKRLMMGAEIFSEMSVSFYQATRRHISAFSVLHKYYYENFISVFFSIVNQMTILCYIHRRHVRCCCHLEKFSCKIQCVINGVIWTLAFKLNLMFYRLFISILERILMQLKSLLRWDCYQPLLNILRFLSPRILERFSTSSLLFIMFCFAYLFLILVQF